LSPSLLIPLRQNSWADESPFEVLGDDLSGPNAFTAHRALLSSPANQHIPPNPDYFRKPSDIPIQVSSDRLFYGFRFFFAGEFGVPSRKDLETLVVVGNGILCIPPPSPPRNTEELLAKDAWKTLVIVDSKKTSEQEARDLFFATGSVPVKGWLTLFPFTLSFFPSNSYIIPLLLTQKLCGSWTAFLGINSLRSRSITIQKSHYLLVPLNALRTFKT
jgi:hypothetical protein